jgi:Zn-dependent protease
MQPSPARPEVDVQAADPRFHEARRLFVEPPPAQTSALLYVGLFLFFVLGQLEGLKSLPGIGLLILVLLFHEAGHAVGMRLFGFRDVRMFFIPFFGAAVSGRPYGVAAWKEALVSLLGPMPGLVLSVLGYVVVQRLPFDALFRAVELLAFVNLFNLLPLGALDGGRFLQRVIFSRHRVLEVGFLSVGSVLLGLLALKANLFVLALFAGMGLLMAPARWRVLGAAADLRRERTGLPNLPSQLDDRQAWALYERASQLTGSAGGVQVRRIADTMTALFEATKPPPGALATFGLLALYAVGGVVGLVAVILTSLDSGPVEWHTVDAAGFRAELPRKPSLSHRKVETPAGALSTNLWRATLHGTQRFTVEAVHAGHPIEDEDRWLDDAENRLVLDTQATMVREAKVEADGLVARDVELSRWGRTVHAHVVVKGAWLYVVVASASEWGADQERFMSSFRPAAAP